MFQQKFPLFDEEVDVASSCSNSCSSSISPLSRGGSVATGSVATDPSSLIHLGYNDIESIGEDTRSFNGQQSQSYTTYSASQSHTTYSEADEESSCDKYQVESTTTGPSIEESLSRNESKLTQSDTKTCKDESSTSCDATTGTLKDKISTSCDKTAQTLNHTVSEGSSYFTNLLTRKY